MAVYEQIGAGTAAAKLAAAKALGLTVQLSHRGATAATLYARFIRERTELVEDGPGIATEVRIVELEIPTQTGLAKSSNDQEPIIPTDKIIYCGRNYWVVDPVEKSAYGYVYSVRIMERKRLASGA